MIDTETRDRRLDVVLDAPASVSIYLQALAAVGRDLDAAALRDAHRSGVTAAWVTLQRHGLWSSSAPRAGFAHAPEPLGARVELVEHQLGGAGGLHSHLLVRMPSEDSVIDRAAALRAMPYVRERYDRELVDALTHRLGLPIRNDDERPELLAVPVDVLEVWHPQPCRALVGAPQLR